MGFFSNSSGHSSATLAPAPFPIGLNPHYCQHGQEVALRLREHKVSMSGDDFTVKDAITGQPLFMVDGKAFSMKKTKTITDAQGRPLFVIQNKLFSIHSSYDAFDPSNPDVALFTIKAAVSWGAKFSVTFNNVAGGTGETVLQLRGDLSNRNADITTADGMLVGRISKQLMNAQQLALDKSTYICSVAPGVDISLLVAICICLDEKASAGKKAVNYASLAAAF